LIPCDCTLEESDAYIEAMFMGVAWSLPMELTLRYSGKVPSSRHRKEKHDIRCCFQTQLADFWARDPRLSAVDLSSVAPAVKSERFKFDVRQQEKRQRVGRARHNRYYFHEVSGIKFVPIVTRWRFLRCELSLTVHRYEGAHLTGGLIDNNGDLDNQLKTLLDALRMPYEPGDLPRGVQHDASHYFVLLEDDRLVTKLHLETKDRLGARPTRQDETKIDVDIDVRIFPVHAMKLNMEMLVP
jgi:hypothetical protein